MLIGLFHRDYRLPHSVHKWLGICAGIWSSAELEFIKDVLSGGDFQWIIKGTDLDRVATKMKQTLGVVAVRGRPGGAQMHESLQNALDAGDITRQRLIDVISKIGDGTLLRAQGY